MKLKDEIISKYKNNLKNIYIDFKKEIKTKQIKINNKKADFISYIRELSKPKFKFKEELNNIKIKIENIKEKNLFLEAQNWIEKNAGSNNESEVLLKRSTRWASYITWSLISGTVFGIGWLAIAETEEIIITQGKLEPISEVLSIQMPFEGITDEILVKEGELIKKEQVLVKLNTELSKTQYNAIKLQHQLQKDIVNRYMTLSKEGAISEIVFLQEQNKLAQIQSQLKEKELLMEYQEIKSPIDGIVFDLLPQEKGYVARTSETIMKIVPGGKLKASVEIDSRSIGLVGTGKKVDISIDSFPASDFGVLQGEVLSIGSDALPPDMREGKGYRFPAIIRLDTQYLEVKDGRKLPLQVGMSLTANIKLRKVSYLRLLLGTFDSKINSLKSL